MGERLIQALPRMKTKPQVHSESSTGTSSSARAVGEESSPVQVINFATAMNDNVCTIRWIFEMDF